MYEYRQVLSRLRLNESSRAIARSGLMGRKKVEALRRVADQKGWLDPSHSLPDDATLAEVLRPPASRPQTQSAVLPYQEDVKKWCREGVRGTVIYNALVRNHGFGGSYSSVRRFIRHMRETDPDATTVLDFDPGDTAQVDFGSGPEITDVHTGQTFRTWAFVMVLAWSRHMYAEMVLDQKVETWLGCHRRAFEWFGGVPARVCIDNLKTAITKASYYNPEVQRAYEELAEGYGFRIAPCPVRDPKKKGRVEAGVKYVRHSFLPLRDFRDLPDANDQLRAWVLGEAGNRIHGTTHERPLTRFVETERSFLNRLPAIPPELAVWAKLKLHGDCHVQFEKCRYSAPWKLVRKQLWMRATQATIRIYHDHEMVAIHPRLFRAGSRSTLREHLPPEAQAYLMRDPQWCLKNAQSIGPACHSLIQTLFADRVLDNLRAAQGVIRLGERYGTSRLEAACRRALHYDNPRYRTVKEILHKGLDEDQDLLTQAQPPSHIYAGNGRFCRDTKRLLN